MINNYRKYGNKKVKVDGKIFDSMKEAYRYQELKMLQEHGKIENLKCQVSFDLIPKHQNILTRQTERKITYKADFVYYENGQMIVEDVKGFRTKDYILKYKMMSYLSTIDPEHYQPIREV